MDCILSNHIIYNKIYSCLSEKQLYELWLNEIFKNSITDYIKHTKSFNWNKLSHFSKLSKDFIKEFKDKIVVNCCNCRLDNILSNCDISKTYIHFSMETGKQFRSVILCKKCKKISFCEFRQCNQIHIFQPK